MSARNTAAAAARKGFLSALDELETLVARRLAQGAAPRAAAQPAMLPGIEPGGAAAGPAPGSGDARVEELERALALALRERDAARAALTALRSARVEEARLVDEALRDLRQAV